MPARTSLHERYELKDVLGRGGMGVVYRAVDTLMNREVALKTILDVENTAAMEFFYSEWSLLATMVHPNVIGIYDIGEFEHEGARKPFFVMPLLPGATLDRLIRARSPRLTVDNVVSIVEQAARGLHAAHERGLVHRDVKPSNIFVMDDDSVKVIDFGIARQSSGRSVTTLRGTPWYFAPEQLDFKAPTPLSDLFALGVVAYETLTLRRPFQGSTEDEVLNAIRRHTPPPVSDLNPNAPYQLSQVIHKALAKHPYHRFPTVREFGDALQKALRNEPLEYFDSAKVTPRLEKARQSFEQGEYDFASDILSELEAEGHLDTGIGLLRGRMDQAMRKVRIQQSLKSARRFVEASEYTLALRKVQEALDLDPEDADALSLHAQVEKERRGKKIEEWLQLGRKHLENNAFRQAREAVENAVRLKPDETEALELLAELGRREQEVSRKRDDKSRLFQAAKQAWEHGEVTSALSKLEVLIEMERGLPETDASRSTAYQNFYNQVRSEHDAIKNSYEEARSDLAADRLESALSICRQQLARYPNHALFTALQFDVEERRRQNLSTVIAETDRAVEQEPDLERRMGILEEALSRYPGEPHFEGALHLVRDKRDLVNSIVSKARFYEERNQFGEALDQWQILRSIHERYPGLSFEIERLMRRRDQQAREDARTRWVEQIDGSLEAGDYARARQNVQGALAEFPGEPDLLELEKLVGKRETQAAEAAKLLARARDLGESGDLAGSLTPLREACKLDPRNMVVRAVLVNSLTETCRRGIAQADWDGAAGTVRELLALQPAHAVAQGLADQIEDHKRTEFISSCAAKARRLQTEGDITGALAAVAEGLAAHPSDQRLLALRATLERAQADDQPTQTQARANREEPTLAAAAASGAGGPEPVPPPAAPPTAGSGSEAPTPVSATGTDSMDALMAQVFAPMTAEPSDVQPAKTSAPLPTSEPASAPPESAPEVPPQTRATVAAPAPARAPEAPADAKAAGNRKVNPRLLYAGIGAAGFIILLIASLGTARLFRFNSSGDATGPRRVALRASVAGAAISVNNKPCGATACEAQLTPGAYIAEARMEGYQTAIATFTVSATDNSPAEIRLQLEPAPAAVNFVTDLKEGALLLDGAPAGQIQGGELAWPRLKPGAHVLAVESADAGVTLSLETPPGAMPSLTRPIETRNARTVLVLRYGSSARVYATAKNLNAALDGAPAQPIPEAGLEIVGLSPGLHEVSVMGAGPARKLIFESAAGGAVYVAVFLDRKSGTSRAGN